VISDGTTPRQHVLTSTLGAVAGEAAAAGVRPPAVVVVGDVVRLRDQLLPAFAAAATDAAAWHTADATAATGGATPRTPRVGRTVPA
jgi:hypothetical protein